MKVSNSTRKYTLLSHIFFLTSMAVTFLPVFTYVIAAYVNGEVQEKATLGITVTVAVILTVVNVLMKYHIRSTLWILVLGIYFCLDNIMPLLLMVAIGTILDEFILSPLHNKYKNLRTINHEMDKRMP